MVSTDWLVDSIGLDAASRAVDAVLVGCLAAAIAVGWLTGLSPVGLVLLVAGSFALDLALGWVTRRRLLETVEITGSGSDRSLRDRVTGLAERMGVTPPRIVVEASLDTGVTVLEGREGPVLLLSRSLRDDLDERALTAVIAHELAHLDRGHIDRFDSREPIAHVVGATVFWVVVGQTLDPVLSLAGLATYVAAGAFRASPLPQLYYLCASLGVVLLPLGVIALAHRLQEHQADDRAVALTDAESFCRGLVHVATARDGGLHEDVLRHAGDSRGLLERTTATHPRLDRRLARYGHSIEAFLE